MAERPRTSTLLLTLLLLLAGLGGVLLVFQQLQKTTRSIPLGSVQVEIGHEAPTAADSSGSGSPARPAVAPLDPEALPSLLLPQQQRRATSPRMLLQRCFDPLPPLPVGATREEKALSLLGTGVRLAGGMAAQTVGESSPGEEEDWTRQLEEEVLRNHELAADPAALQRVTPLFERLLDVFPGSGRLRLTLLQGPEPNAFTLPGGRVFVFTGLLDTLEDDDALAFVLAHEMGHQAAGHNQEVLRAALAGGRYGQLAGELLGQGKSRRHQGQGEAAGQQLALLTRAIVSSTYDQDREYEADRLGLCLVLQAGFRREGGMRALEQVAAAGSSRPIRRPEGVLRIAYDIIATHPPVEERQRYLTLLLGSSPAEPEADPAGEVAR